MHIWLLIYNYLHEHNQQGTKSVMHVLICLNFALHFLCSWFFSYMITPFHLTERYGKYSMIQNGSTWFIVQLIGFVRRALTSAWTVSDVYQKVWLTKVSHAISLQISYIFSTVKMTTAAVASVDRDHIVRVLKVLYLNTQKPLSAGHLHNNHP